MDLLEIDGSFLEGGGQILRTAVAFSCITQRPIKITNIRTKRKSPGLKPQHLHILKTLKDLFDVQTQGLESGSQKISFSPRLNQISKKHLEVDIGTAGAIGLFLQSLLLVSAFKSEELTLTIKGGTAGLGSVPVEYYPNVIFPILKRVGLKASLKILRRGYYPKGGGIVEVNINRITKPDLLQLIQAGNPVKIFVQSIASKNLSKAKVCERQASKAKEILSKRFNLPLDERIEYADTYSVGTELNLWIKFDSGCILWSDVRGQKGMPAEDIAKEATQKLFQEIDSGAAVDTHLADNLIPWLAILGGAIRTSQISLHTQTNIWVAEQFFGKPIFKVEDNLISRLTNSNAGIPMRVWN